MKPPERRYRLDALPHDELTHLAAEVAVLVRATPGMSERMRGLDLVVHVLTAQMPAHTATGLLIALAVTEVDRIRASVDEITAALAQNGPTPMVEALKSYLEAERTSAPPFMHAILEHALERALKAKGETAMHLEELRAALARRAAARGGAS